MYFRKYCKYFGTCLYAETYKKEQYAHRFWGFARDADLRFLSSETFVWHLLIQPYLPNISYNVQVATR
jgi:hypothetical protein